MTLPAFLTNFTQKMYNAYSKDGGKLLVIMGSAGWVFSSIAQIGMLLGDKKIDKEQKKFLLPQEGADAAVNVLMYFSISALIKKWADCLVEKGKFLTDDVVKEILKMKPSNMSALQLKEWKKLFTESELNGKLTNLLSKAYKLDVINNAPKADKRNMFNAAKNALEVLEKHKNNVGICAAIGASILASNVITPVVRNYVAAKVQKHLQNKEAVQIRKTQIKENITMKNPLPTSFKSFNNYNSFGNIKI